MQYVGARYVPKFMDTYDPTTTYENMCVVDNGMGTSYISKKPVPAGTPLTDTEYWALYGASNGAIINLQNQIDVLNNKVKIAYFETVSDMRNADLTGYDYAITSGYYSANDGGDAKYVIVDTAPATHYETNVNGKYCELIVDDVANIKQFGAHADDTNDDSVIIQSVIDDYNNVYIPTGTYKIDNVIDIPLGRFFHLTGDGQESILHGENIFKIHNRAEMLSSIENLRFSAELSADPAAGIAILLGDNGEGVANLTIRNCYFKLCYKAIEFNAEVDNTHIEDCYFFENKISCIRCNDTSTTHAGIYVNGCHFQGCYDGATSIYLERVINLNVTDCVFEAGTRNNLRFIYLEHSSSIVLMNNYFEISGTTSATNKIMKCNNCTDIYINTADASGNTSGVDVTPDRTALDFVDSRNVQILNFNYRTTGYAEYLIGISGISKNYRCNWSGVIPVANLNLMHFFNFVNDVNNTNKPLDVNSPSRLFRQDPVTPGETVKIDVNTIVGYDVNHPYLVCVKHGSTTSLHIITNNIVSHLITDSTIDVAVNGNDIEITNLTSGTNYNLYASIYHLM